MNEQKKFVWLVFLSLAILVAAYAFSAKVTINVSRMASMLSMADVKGLTMFYFSVGDWSYAAAIAAGILQSLAPFLSKSAVLAANLHFFGNTAGAFLTLGGFTLGAWYALLLGKLWVIYCVIKQIP